MVCRPSTSNHHNVHTGACLGSRIAGRHWPSCRRCLPRHFSFYCFAATSSFLFMWHCCVIGSLIALLGNSVTSCLHSTLATLDEITKLFTAAKTHCKMQNSGPFTFGRCARKHWRARRTQRRANADKNNRRKRVQLKLKLYQHVCIVCFIPVGIGLLARAIK